MPVFVVVLLLVVILIQLWAALKTMSSNSGDVALIEMQTRDVFSANPPLAGAYSRYGWSHPGPLLFFILAIPYRLLGSDAQAMRLGALALNALALVVVVFLLSRRGRVALAAGSIAMAALIFGLLPNALLDSWNVTIAIVPFTLVIIACWCALCGDRHALLIAAVGYAFVLQAHIGFGVVLAPMFVTTVVVLIVQARRADRPIDRRASVRLGAVMAVAFLPVICDTVVHFPGNIGRLLKWSIVNDEPKVGYAGALRVVARTSSLSFLRNPQVPHPFTFAIDHVSVGTAPALLLVALVASVIVAIRRGWRPEALLGGLLVLTWVAAIVAVATVTLPLYFWLIDWLQPIAWLTWCSVALVVCRWMASLQLDRTRTISVGTVGVGVLAIVSIVAGAQFIDDSRSEANASTNDDIALKTLVSAAKSIDPAVRTLVSFDGDDLVASSVMDGVFNELDRAGFSLCVDDDLAYKYGDNRKCGRPTTAHLIVRSEPSALDPPEGSTTLVIVDPLSADERSEADSLTERLSAILIEEDRSDEVPLLASALVVALLQNDPPPELLAESEAIERLAELRRRDGTRLGEYVVTD